ncbi:type IV secretory system Conjugative DNA transfer family protein [Rickettsia parkeri str. Tate's Hell]|uniref:Type IV secretory system Conjugative DNA transfer family protein n=1 Tax=Rickettsia parkeri str. Tate's Hell TaxID=1359189 RepID=A0ABR5DPS3_RICPA|nr:type IV secretion system DNA-binding domain-containing protein [Rickettsia parkeri]AFC74907.1 conjugative transfer protein TraD [Rickettsia parkeri str. Portsmouth]KJV94320.1 type IV secretory system Conjugative DNA transfer family protein [Rickettsia parkeri str. Grand Bay]KJV95824.1 type IV secretory system Conjugative DNA transfer family protein [Rickettsia parkeri str. AT\
MQQNQNNFTRGSQIFAHQMRMLGQGSINALIAGLVFTVVWLMWRIYQKLSLVSLYYFIIERYAELKLAIGEHFYPIDQIGIKFYYLEQKAWVYCNAEEFIHKFWHITPHSHNINQLGQFLLHSAWQEGIITFTIGLFTAIIFFMYRGKKAVIQDKIRGADFVEAKTLARMLHKNNQASNICFSGLPLVKSSERRHILITGTTGSGKTNMINELLPQIRKERGRAIIVDLTGSFTDRFFDPKFDKLLNPLQENTEHWLPWNDCHEIWDYNDMASNFSNYNPKLDDFFAKSAELVLAEGLRLYQDSKDIKKLINTILYANNKEFVRSFKNSAVSSIISSSAPETSSGIQATISKNIAVLQHLQPDGKFSIKRWFRDKEEKGWLFITATPNQRVMLQPLIAAWISIAIKALMHRNINNTHSNMWFVIDELPALQKISSLGVALAESRKYGGCVVAGMQNIHQLEEIYGHARAASMLDLFGSKFIFRVSDQQTAHKSSLMLGEQEIIETQENLSYGANSMRDGVNMNHLERRKLLVMPAEIMNLPDLTCYVKLVGNFPITKLPMNLQI